jgi:serine-type D-Ala-D-Ala carboxypeptidase/endopeptidase (penicillin-binding protein 4)
MKRCLLITTTMLLLFTANAQSIKERLDVQVKKLVADSQMKHGILGFYVADANTGEAVYEWNGHVGLAPASTQKIVTSVAAFDLLGKDYQYKTEFGYNGTIAGGQLKGDVYVKGTGDPTFGSSRYSNTKADIVLSQLADKLKQSGIKKFAGNVYVDASSFSYQPLPGGWIWDDIGNYYGAGSWGLNWRENQYDLLLKPGNKEGDDVTITGTTPKLYTDLPANRLKTGKKGSGDNAYIYYPPYSSNGFVEGTFEGANKISGSFPDAPRQFGFEVEQLLRSLNIKTAKTGVLYSPSKVSNTFLTHYSPPMDSIVYWFMRRSINLYGEALVKTIGLEKSGVGSTDTGVAVVRRFYKENGIATPAELRIMDGSGLSPSNRLTAASLGKILVHAKMQAWFPSFDQSFPEFNGMKLKSGTIRGAKAFAGYHTSKEGKEYVVAIIVNNYDGTAGAIVSKMYRVLDELK